MVKKHISNIPKRREDTNKGNFGHVLVLAGSPGMTGAAFLASQAAIKSGSGLVTCGIPESLNDIMEIKLTEVMTKSFPETKNHSFSLSAEKEILKFSEKASVIAIGPGISRHKDTLKLVRILLRRLNKPVVLDADGIMALVGQLDILKKRKAPTVLTPHPGEMSKLISKSVQVIQAIRSKIASEFAKKYGVTLALKGYRTVVASPKGEIYLNKTGNSGMSTAGSGDVLTGMIASFIGQGINPYSSTALGSYLHGLAGDLAARENGPFGMIASDILSKVPQAIKEVL